MANAENIWESIYKNDVTDVNTDSDDNPLRKIEFEFVLDVNGHQIIFNASAN